MGLIIVGSVALDDVKTSFGVKERVLGGAASFASVSASFFHKDVYLVGVVGGDFPKEHIEFFRSRNIDLKGLEVIENGKTFHWKGTYEYNMNQAHTLDTQLNVFQNFQPKIPVVYREAEFVFLANIDPDLQLDVLRQIKNPKFTACDTMNLWINQKKDKVLEVMKNTNMVFINDAEARQLCETYSLPAAAKHILNLGPLVVIIKKGEHGALLYTKEIVLSLPGFPLEEVKDPTGAGDTFAGGLMGFLAETGKVTPGNLKKGIVYASVMASYNVEDFSLDKMSKLKSVDIEWRYEAFKNLTSFE